MMNDMIQMFLMAGAVYGGIRADLYMLNQKILSHEKRIADLEHCRKIFMEKNIYNLGEKKNG